MEEIQRYHQETKTLFERALRVSEDGENQETDVWFLLDPFKYLFRLTRTPFLSKTQSPGQRGDPDKPQNMLRYSIDACTHAIMRMMNFLSAARTLNVK